MGKNKSYGKGLRYEITKYLLNCGTLTYTSLSILPLHHRNASRKVKNMLDEEFLLRHRVKSLRNLQVLSLNYSKTRNILESNYSRELLDYYDLAFESSLFANTKLWSMDSIHAQRFVYNSEIQAFMYASGLNNGAIDALDTVYISSPDLKRMLTYEDDVMVDYDGKKILGFTKSNGIAICPQENYAVYYAKKVLPKLSLGEAKLRNLSCNYAMKRNQTSKINGLIVVSDLHLLADYLDPCSDLNINGEDMRLDNFFALYDKVYAVPYTPAGVETMRYMTTPDWETRTIHRLTGQVPQDNRYLNFECDYFDRETKTATLIFCIPNIKRLRNFLYAAKNTSGITFRIVCYDYQEAFIKTIAPAIKIGSISLTKIKED